MILSEQELQSKASNLIVSLRELMAEAVMQGEFCKQCNDGCRQLMLDAPDHINPVIDYLDALVRLGASKSRIHQLGEDLNIMDIWLDRLTAQLRNKDNNMEHTPFYESCQYKRSGAG